MLSKIFRRIIRAIYVHNKLVFYEKTGDQSGQEPDSVISSELLPGMEIVDLTHDNLKGFEGVDKVKLLKEIEKGSGGKVIILGSRIVHYSCVAYSKLFLWEVQRSLLVPHDIAYIYNCFTAPDFRGKSLFPIMLVHITQDRSKRYMISVLEDNVASAKSIKKANFNEAGFCRYRRMLFIEQIENNTKLKFV